MTNFQKKFELFLGKENFSKKLWLITTAVVPQHLDVKDTEKSRIIFHHYQHAKINQSVQFTKSFVGYTWFYSLSSIRSHTFLTMPTQ